MCNCIPAFYITDHFDTGNYITNLSCFEFFHGGSFNLEKPHFFYFVFPVSGHENNSVSGLDASLDKAAVDNDTPVGIIMGIKNQRLKKSIGIPFWSRKIFNCGFKNLMNSNSFFCRHKKCCLAVKTQIFIYLILCPFYFCGRKIDFIDYRDNLQIMLHGKIKVCKGLCFHPLGSINKKKCSFARGKSP